MPPEGIDDARDAFAAELNPQAPARPRDSGGRFAAAKAAPEPMFEPRPVEGDEKTGDTRDGGEDKRLAEREKKVADRSKDFDEPPAQADPERLGEEDSEEPEGGEEAETETEGEPEPEDKGPKYEVTIDGQTQEVSLNEALRGYIREATFHQRMNKVAEARQQIEQEAQTTVQARDYYTQKLNYVGQLINELTPPAPDWDQEFRADPNQARAKQKAYQAIYDKMQLVNGELARTQAEAAQDYDQKSRRYAVEQFSQFVREAKIPDEKALNARMSRMRNYAKTRGFSEGEIATVYDSRMLACLDDAARYHEMMASKPKPVIPGKGRTLTPGVATPVGNAGRRNIDEAQRKLAQSGRLDDAAALFERLIR